MLRCFPSIPGTVRTAVSPDLSARLSASSGVSLLWDLPPVADRQIREATEDDIIPLQNPITTLSGEKITSVRIRKGQIVHLPIENLNMAQSIWGLDAREFKPERWIVRDPTSGAITGTAVPSSVGDGPGVWSNVMTFIDGPRRCVGYRLGIMEMKIMLYTLIREFEFGAVPGKKVYKTNMWVGAREGEKTRHR